MQFHPFASPPGCLVVPLFVVAFTLAPSLCEPTSSSNANSVIDAQNKSKLGGAVDTNPLCKFYSKHPKLVYNIAALVIIPTCVIVWNLLPDASDSSDDEHPGHRMNTKEPKAVMNHEVQVFLGSWYYQVLLGFLIAAIIVLVACYCYFIVYKKKVSQTKREDSQKKKAQVEDTTTPTITAAVETAGKLNPAQAATGTTSLKPTTPVITAKVAPSPTAPQSTSK